MSAENPQESPENPCYDDGRKKRMRPEDVEPGQECLIRFRNTSTGDIFEMAVRVREPVNAGGSECDRLYVDVHCTKTFDREVEFKFDKESGCLIQFCGGEQQEIGYIVGTVKDPDEALAVFATEASAESAGSQPAST
jgi:hypothetical protein